MQRAGRDTTWFRSILFNAAPPPPFPSPPPPPPPKTPTICFVLKRICNREYTSSSQTQGSLSGTFLALFLPGGCRKPVIGVCLASWAMTPVEQPPSFDWSRVACVVQPQGFSNNAIRRTLFLGCLLQPLSLLVEMLPYVHRNRRLNRDGSLGRPPRLSHSFWALPLSLLSPYAFITVHLHHFRMDRIWRDRRHHFPDLSCHITFSFGFPLPRLSGCLRFVGCLFLIFGFTPPPLPFPSLPHPQLPIFLLVFSD